MGLDDWFTAPVLEMCFLLCPESLLHMGWGCMERELLGRAAAQPRKGEESPVFQPMLQAPDLEPEWGGSWCAGLTGFPRAQHQ